MQAHKFHIEEQKSKIPTLAENTYFESYLAIMLAKRQDLFPVLKKVSETIIQVMDDYKSEIKKLLSNDKLFKEVQFTVYNGDFGVFSSKQKKNTVEEILADMKYILQHKDSYLFHILPIQFIFNFRIFSLLKLEKYNKIFDDFWLADIYVQSAKNFVIRQKNIKSTKQIGVSRFPEVCKKINELPETKEILNSLSIRRFVTSFERFEIDYDRVTLREFIRYEAPMVAGPSTHTMISLAAVQVLMPELTTAELKEYAFAYFVFAACAGYHTFHEIMGVAHRCLSQSYTMNNYYNNLPDNIRESQFIAELRDKFPLHLQVPAEPKEIKVPISPMEIKSPPPPSVPGNALLRLFSCLITPKKAKTIDLNGPEEQKMEYKEQIKQSDENRIKAAI